MRMYTVLLIVLLTGFAVKSEELTNDASTKDIHGPRVIVDANMQDTVDTWFKGASTNGIVCAIGFAHSYRKGAPVFEVNIINATTNFIRGFLRFPFEKSVNLKLLDSGRLPVPKTEKGEKIKVGTDQELEEWFEENRQKPGDDPERKVTRNSKGIVDILFPLMSHQISSEISLPQLFKLKRAGEYELHLQMRAALVRVDSADKITLTMFSFPEVVAKVQIPEQNTAPTEDNTNLPPK
jgi:hypothetical protein